MSFKNKQKLIAFAFGAVFVVVMIMIALFVPNPTQTQWFVFRVVLSLAVAGVGAIIPGLLAVNISKTVRAGGAIALFVLVYLLNPAKLVADKPSISIQQTTGGSHSPAIISNGDVSITDGTKQEDKKK